MNFANIRTVCGARFFLIFTLSLTLLLALAAGPGANAASKKKPVGTATPRQDALVINANSGVVGVIAGGIGGTYIRIATDLSSVLDGPQGLRVLAIAGKGSLQNISDLLYLRGIDIAIVQSDVLAFMKASGKYPGLQQKVRFVTKLYNEEFHLIARNNIRTVKDLAGKKVNFGHPGSGTHMTSSIVFRALRVRPKVTSFDSQLALTKLKNGEIDALVLIAGKPVPLFAKLNKASGLHLVPVPLAGRLQNTYFPGTFGAADYPGLFSGDETIETISVGAVMAVFNWKKRTERYYRVRRFINAFFSRFDAFGKPPRHRKWHEVNLAANVPGWQRYSAAQDWLNASKTTARKKRKMSARQLRTAFNAFLDRTGSARGLSAQKREELFQNFLKWKAQP